MNHTWFIGDTHFGHKKILEFEAEARPFATVEEMNESIIDRWNATVKPNDTVYHLGDVCFGRDNLRMVSRLSGRKILLLGNHDHYPISDYLQYFSKIFGASAWHECILTHIPIHPSCLDGRWKLNATPNGWHYIVERFDPRIISHIKDCEVKKDALLLLNYLNKEPT